MPLKVCPQIKEDFVKLLVSWEDFQNEFKDVLEKHGKFDVIKNLKTEIDGQLENLRNKTQDTVIDTELIRLDMKNVRLYWENFYEENGLEELVKYLPRRIILTPGQIQLLAEKSFECDFNSVILLPPLPAQRENHQKIIEGMQKPIPGAENDRNQYAEASFPSPYSEFPEATNRPTNHPYLLFTKDEANGYFNGTGGKSPLEIRKIFDSRGETGFTLSEYLFFQRNFYRNFYLNKLERPDKDFEGGVYLLDSKFSDGTVAAISWYSAAQRLYFTRKPENNESEDFYAREAVILPLI